LEPGRGQALVTAVRDRADGASAHGTRPVLLCSARVRRHLRRLCEQTLPNLAVCSYNEIVPGIRVETVGVVEA
jgi:flagellar biosynthesis protein FlhA